jgi:hypothetical protein
VCPCWLGFIVSHRVVPLRTGCSHKEPTLRLAVGQNCVHRHDCAVHIHVNHQGSWQGSLGDRLHAAMALLAAVRRLRVQVTLMSSQFLGLAWTLDGNSDDVRCSCHTVRTLSFEVCDSNSKTFPKGAANAAALQQYTPCSKFVKCKIKLLLSSPITSRVR